MYLEHKIKTKQIQSSKFVLWILKKISFYKLSIMFALLKDICIHMHLWLLTMKIFFQPKIPCVYFLTCLYCIIILYQLLLSGVIFVVMTEMGQWFQHHFDFSTDTQTWVIMRYKICIILNLICCYLICALHLHDSLPLIALLKVFNVLIQVE